MARFWQAMALTLSLASCQMPAWQPLGAPPPGDFDRPMLVRGAGQAGSYIGAVVGIVPTILMWPVGKGLNAMFDEPLGYTEKEWVVLPLAGFAVVGHYAVGLPVEGVYQLFWGLWVDGAEPVGFGHVPGAEEEGESAGVEVPRGGR